MPRKLRLALLLLLLLAACAGRGDFGARYQAGHPGSRPALPHRGQPAEEALAALYLDPAPEARVEVPLLLLRRTDQLPWTPVSSEAFAASPGRVAAIALRECRPSKGWIRPRVTRAAWYLFVEGELAAWDLPRFREACSVHHSYRAARGKLARDEQALERWIAQRHSDALPRPLEQLGMGISLVEADRMDEAAAILQHADLALRALHLELRRAQDTGDAEARERLAEREKGLRERHARLTQAIDAHNAASEQQARRRWERGL